MCNNGIEHGNKEITKSVVLEIEIQEERHIQVSVADQGEGFDLNKVNLSVSDNAGNERSYGLPWFTRWRTL